MDKRQFPKRDSLTGFEMRRSGMAVRFSEDVIKNKHLWRQIYLAV